MHAAILGWLLLDIQLCIASGPGSGVKELTYPIFGEQIPYRNLKDFLDDPKKYIWTMNGTLRDECIMCLVDAVINITDQVVYLWRNYSRAEATISKLLRGKFGNVPGHPPSAMRVTVELETVCSEGVCYTMKRLHKAHTEALAYVEKMCGVFFTRVPTMFADDREDGNHMFKHDPFMCELRVKADHATMPVIPKGNCWQEFKRMCGRSPFYPVYKEYCLLPTSHL